VSAIALTEKQRSGPLLRRDYVNSLNEIGVNLLRAFVLTDFQLSAVCFRLLFED